MNFIKENKKTILISLSLILVTFLIVIFVNKDQKDEEQLIDEDVSYLKDYKINELIPINMTEEQIARKYLAEYTKLIYNDPERAYDLIDYNYRAIKFKNIDAFKEYFDKEFDSTFFNAKVEQLEIKKVNGLKEYHIIDSSNNMYIFKESSIMNYKVMFDNYTI